MNFIEFVLQDEHGGVHAGRISNPPGVKERFTEAMLENFRERFLEEGFTVLELKISEIQ